MTVDLCTPEGEVYQPLPAQASFHASPALNKCYIGGFGSGKTLCGAMETLMICLAPERQRGQQFLVCRYDYSSLEDTTWKTLLDIIPDPVKDLCRITRGAGRLRIVLPNGVEILGRNLKNHQRVAGFNLIGGWIDECNEDGVDESFFLQLRGRMRDMRVDGVVLLTGNPGGRNWVWERFFAWKEGKRKFEGHEGFQAGTAENKYLKETYLRQLKETYPQEWLDRYFSGDFGVLEGQILTEFDPDIHIVQAFPIPDFWSRYRGLDPGINHPTCCLWWGSDLQGFSVIYREYIKRGQPVAENARAILTASLPEEEQILWTVIDPAAEQRVSTGAIVQTTLQQYLEAGLHCYLGDHDMKSSILRLKQLLAPNPERMFPPWHHLAGQPGSPLLFISSACPYTKWEFEGWRWRDLKPGQIDREKVHAENDDCIACARYIAMRSPSPGVTRPVPVSAGERIRAILEQVAAERRGQDQEWVGRDRLAYT